MTTRVNEKQFSENLECLKKLFFVFILGVMYIANLAFLGLINNCIVELKTDVTYT